MTEIERIVAEMRRMNSGPAWHGPSLAESLDGITAAQAAQRPVSHGHTIYELTHHTAAWMGEVRHRLEGRTSGNPDEGDWPAADAPVDERSWQEMLASLRAAQDALLEKATQIDPAQLDAPVDPSASPPGNRVTHYILLHGSIQHAAYHAGQIMMVRRALGT